MHEFLELERHSTVEPAAFFAVHPHGSPLCRTSRCIAAPGALNLGIAQHAANRPETMTVNCNEYPAFRAVTSRVCSIQAPRTFNVPAIRQQVGPQDRQPGSISSFVPPRQVRFLRQSQLFVRDELRSTVMRHYSYAEPWVRCSYPGVAPFYVYSTCKQRPLASSDQSLHAL